MGEHLPCKQGVKGSIPFISTRSRKGQREQGKADEGPGRHGLIAQLVRARA